MLFLNTGQVEQLADAIGPHYRVLVYLLAYTGLRFGEVAAAVAPSTRPTDGPAVVELRKRPGH